MHTSTGQQHLMDSRADFLITKNLISKQKVISKKHVSFGKQLMDSGAAFEFCYLKVQLRNKGLNNFKITNNGTNLLL